YTLALGNNQTHAANAAMLPSLPFDPVADFAPIAKLATVHHALVVPVSGAKTLAELAAKGRNGGKVTYASSGAGSASHVIAETFARRERLDATHVPYRGGAQVRLPEAPDVPTFAELNAPDLAVDAWFGLWAPARTAPEIVTRLSDTLLRILAEPAAQRSRQSHGSRNRRRKTRR
ncbi:MAG: Bug family tripartite tricarboxylate transporter substrate binding protein, partial [Alphaproteobacteria bacterium]